MRYALIIFCLVVLFSTVADTKIVFSSKRDGISGIYVMNDDGSNVTLLTDKRASNYPHYPRWSPDGKQILFRMRVSLPENYEFHLFLMNTSGTNIRPLAEPQVGINNDAIFSPDGKQVLFTRDTFKKHCSYILDLESGEIIELPDIVANSPDWSPDGRQIVFASTSFAIAGGPGGNIWIMDADGENAQELLPTPVVDGKIIDCSYPRWSPDGKQILYTETEYKFEQRGFFAFHIAKANRYFICDQNGEHILQLSISKKLMSKGIDWMDNGESVLFSAAKLELNKPILGNNHHYNIYKYHILTKKTRQLTDHPGNDRELDWISGYTLPVSPKSKILTRWGEIKNGSLKTQ